MSIKSTHYTTRQVAIETIMSRVWTLNDEDLAWVLECAVHNGFYNFIIVPNLDSEPSERTINSVAQMPEYNNAG